MSKPIPGLPIPAAPTSVMTTRTIQVLIPNGPVQVKIVHENTPAIQYEFYIPAAVYRHSAVRRFITRLGSVAPGATIFKGATGTWEGDEEDVNIYRLILGGEFDAANVRSGLHAEIADMMSQLATWKESRQKAFLFTETLIQMDLASLRRFTPPQSTPTKVTGARLRRN